jgi:hypothetical protein
MRNFKTIMAAVAAATVIVTGAASTAKAASLFGVTGGENITYHNWEDIFNSNGTQVTSSVTVNPGGSSVGGSAATVTSVGQVVVGVLQLNTATATGGGNLTVPTTVTGIFALQVSAIVLPGQALPANLGGGTYTGTTPLINYAPLASNPGTFTGGDGSTFTLPSTWNYAEGQEFAFYIDGASNAASPSGLTLAQSIATFVPGGTPYFSLGTATTGNGDQTGYFYSVVQSGSTAAQPLINGYAGLNFIIGPGPIFSPVVNTGIPLDSTVLTDISINNAVASNVPVLPSSGYPVGSDGLIAPWDFISRDPAQVNIAALVPVPAAVWSGLSMLAGLGGIAALRRRKAARA